ncbi:MAG TPA: flagellar hook-basal body protein [Chloroflexota bacterium]|nr:flagellar hook-basal body protein [Chloroflexota bacterium]
MEVSQRIAVTGMLASQRQLDVVSNNLANANSTGFKKAVAHTTDAGYQAGLNAPVGPGGIDVRLVGIGEGTQLADINHEFMPGAVQATGNPLDVALQGDGFFQVTMPDGSTGYTRDGSFGLNATGQLVTSGGLAVQSTTGGNLVVPPGSISVRFDDGGQLMATDPTGAEQAIGALGLAQFPNNGGLLASGQSLWTPTATSGAAMPVTTTAATAPLVVAGGLEASNVDMAVEFTRLIQAQRSYQMNSKVVQAWDDIERMAHELRSA